MSDTARRRLLCFIGATTAALLAVLALVVVVKPYIDADAERSRARQARNRAHAMQICERRCGSEEVTVRYEVRVPISAASQGMGMTANGSPVITSSPGGAVWTDVCTCPDGRQSFIW